MLKIDFVIFTNELVVLKNLPESYESRIQFQPVFLFSIRKRAFLLLLIPCTHVSTTAIWNECNLM